MIHSITRRSRFIEPPNIISKSITTIFTTRFFRDSLDAISKEINISKDNIYLPVQKHTDKVHVLDSGMEPVVADAVLTDRKGVLIGVLAADCVPLLIFDRIRHVAGAVHAGWRGTSKQILRNTIEMMKQRFSSSTGDILIAIGPSIKRCCYEVDGDVKGTVEDATGKGDYYVERDGKYYLDLSSANMMQAISAGVSETNIWRSGECTCCNPERFYSYRHEKGKTGRQGGFIGMW